MTICVGKFNKDYNGQCEFLFVSHLKGIGDGLLVSLRKSREMKGLTGIYSLIFVVKTRLEIAQHQSPCHSHLFISK